MHARMCRATGRGTCAGMLSVAYARLVNKLVRHVHAEALHLSAAFALASGEQLFLPPPY
jgi:hypothetical protein